MSEPGIELRWTVPGEGLPELVLELYKDGPLSGKDLLLLLPTSRAVTEAKRIVARNGGGLTGGIITVEALADKLYDMSGSGTPLLTRSAREMKIREIIGRDKPASFTGRGSARPGMVKRISEAVSDLMMEGLGPDKLRSASSSRREVDMILVILPLKKAIRHQLHVMQGVPLDLDLDLDLNLDIPVDMLHGEFVNFRKLNVYQFAIRFLPMANELAANIPRPHSSLADQLRRAALSIPLNIAEGSGKTSDADQRRFYVEVFQLGVFRRDRRFGIVAIAGHCGCSLVN